MGEELRALKVLEDEVRRRNDLGSLAAIDWQDITKLEENRVFVSCILTLAKDITLTCKAEANGIDEAKNKTAKRIIDLLNIKVGTGLGTIPPPGVCKISEKVYYYEDPDNMLGKGRYAKVYRGFLENDWRQMAIKIVKKKHIDDPRSKELRILSKKHKNLVMYYITEQKSNYYYIVLDLADTRLDLWLKEKHDNEKLINACRDIAEGLKYLHSNNVVHRDLKPNNVLIFYEDGITIAKLSDYGISRIVDEHTGEWITDDGKKGAKTFIPPEAYKKNNNLKVALTKSFDIFSLGILFVFIMTDRKHLFALRDEDVDENIQSNIIDMKTNWKLVSTLQLTSLKNLLEDKMIKLLPQHRAEIERVLEHPFFFTNKEIYEAMARVHLSVTNQVTDATKLQNAYNRYMKKHHPDTPQDWRLRLDLPIQEWMADRQDPQKNPKMTDLARKKINPKWVTHLISFIRDQKEHYGGRVDHPVLSLPHLFGKDDCNYTNYFTQKFPELAFVLLDALPKCVKKNSALPQEEVVSLQPRLSEYLLFLCLYKPAFFCSQFIWKICGVILFECFYGVYLYTKM